MTSPLSDDQQDLPQWIRLLETPGVGSESARRLLRAFGLPAHIFSADFAALRTVVSERVAKALLAPVSAQIQTLIERTLQWGAQPGNAILTLADDHYPAALLHISDPPVLLYLQGRTELLSAPALAVVGSRNASVQGVQNSGHFSEAVSRAGITVVSGLALGIDTAAHQGGLRADASSVAVIGTGIDSVYPSRNRVLAERLAEEGCIVSEYALGTPPMAGNFPRRNRIISGLAKGVLVIEAAAQSGSLITARMAAEQGRDVFAIPGSIHSPLSKGCHLLIKQGAKLVESAQDILDELLPLHANTACPRKLAGQKSRLAHSDDLVLQAMGFDPVDTDALCLRSGLDAASLTTHLLTLELDGMIECLPGGSYRRLQ